MARGSGAVPELQRSRFSSICPDEGTPEGSMSPTDVRLLSSACRGPPSSWRVSVGSKCSEGDDAGRSPVMKVASPSRRRLFENAKDRLFENARDSLFENTVGGSRRTSCFDSPSRSPRRARLTLLTSPSAVSAAASAECNASQLEQLRAALEQKDDLLRREQERVALLEAELQRVESQLLERCAALEEHWRDRSDELLSWVYEADKSLIGREAVVVDREACNEERSKHLAGEQGRLEEGKQNLASKKFMHADKELSLQDREAALAVREAELQEAWDLLRAQSQAAVRQQSPGSPCSVEESLEDEDVAASCSEASFDSALPRPCPLKPPSPSKPRQSPRPPAAPPPKLQVKEDSTGCCNLLLLRLGFGAGAVVLFFAFQAAWRFHDLGDGRRILQPSAFAGLEQMDFGFWSRELSLQPRSSADMYRPDEMQALQRQLSNQSSQTDLTCSLADTPDEPRPWPEPAAPDGRPRPRVSTWRQTFLAVGMGTSAFFAVNT
eukprot:TRINITY_DN26093_c0_g1_i1.p1 TRINITY_DN26093_c0_g1~~TRINITY_DN26093_c0_g1_i1.p1  ORF type:complete len:495 (+),score=122.53 TRINITY_DN26093_c0_g1_i1:97-1581(+)